MAKKSYDIKLNEPRDRKVAERNQNAETRKVDWEQAMREAVEAERLARGND